MEENSYISLNLLQKGKVFKTQIKKEYEFLIDTLSVKKVVKEDAKALINSVTVKDKKIEFSGKSIGEIIFIDIDGEIKCLKKTEEILGDINDENIIEKDKYFYKVCTVKIEQVKEEDKIVLTSYIDVEFTLFSEKQLSILSNGENLIKDKEEVSQYRSLGIKTGTYPIEEECEFNYEIKEVLSQSVCADITAVQCGVGSIIVDGQIYVDALFLQNVEKSDIIKEEKNIPFRMEVEYEDAMPSMSALLRICQSAIKTEIEVDENSGKSTAKFSIVLYYSCEVYSEEKITVVKDVFSKTHNIETEKEELELLCPLELKKHTEKVVSRTNIVEIPAGARLMAISGAKAQLCSCSISEFGAISDGTLKMDLYFKTQDGDCILESAEIPFEIKSEEIKGFNSYSCYELLAINPRARVISTTEVEISADIIVTVKPIKTEKIICIKSANVKEVKEEENSAISVYIPIEGETLWSLSKRLNEDPEDLIKNNSDLEFPLKGTERIVIYRQK